MDLSTALQRMEELLGLVDTLLTTRTEQFGAEKRDRLIALYGEVEDVIHQFEGTESIKVNRPRGEAIVYKDQIAAGFLSGMTTHYQVGRTQLVKVISKVRARMADPGFLETPASVDQLLRAVRRFRECCQFLKQPPGDEAAVQDIMWIMLRAQFDRVDREETLPRFGVKGHKPDFGVPDLRTLIEVKYIGPKTDPGQIQEEILADVEPYLKNNPSYSGLMIVVYDAAQKLRDARKFIEDLRSVEGIIEVIVIPGV